MCREDAQRAHDVLTAKVADGFDLGPLEFYCTAAGMREARCGGCCACWCWVIPTIACAVPACMGPWSVNVGKFPSICVEFCPFSGVRAETRPLCRLWLLMHRPADGALIKFILATAACLAFNDVLFRQGLSLTKPNLTLLALTQSTFTLFVSPNRTNAAIDALADARAKAMAVAASMCLVLGGITSVQRLSATVPPQLGKSSNQSHSFGICLL